MANELRSTDMPDQLTYTADQVARAARELRDAAGASEQSFTAPEVIAMLSDEVRLLRERGFSDQRIAELFSGFDIQTSAEEIARNAQPSQPTA
jgi:alkylhydroperoxidase family enzyme